MDINALTLELIIEMEAIMEKLKSPEVAANFDARCISLAKTKLEECQLWFANSHK